MRAVVRQAYGGPEVVRVADLPLAPPRSEPGPGRVLLRVRAAGIDRGTWHLMNGTPLVVRLGLGLRRPRRPRLGRDVAGVVEAVGPGVTATTGLAVGDEVFGTAPGALAEQVVARADRVVPVPPGLSAEEAATLPVSGVTALQALRDRARVARGSRVLVVGASGGVGSFAVQLAVAMGCEVVGTCSPAKADAVLALGAARVLDRHAPLPADGSFDAVLEIGGARDLAELRGALRPTGRLVLVGGEGGGALLGPVRRQLGATLASLPRRDRRASLFVAGERAAELEQLAGYVRRGELRPLVHRTYELEDTAAALAALERGEVIGKVAVRVG